MRWGPGRSQLKLAARATNKTRLSTLILTTICSGERAVELERTRDRGDRPSPPECHTLPVTSRQQQNRDPMPLGLLSLAQQTAPIVKQGVDWTTLVVGLLAFAGAAVGTWLVSRDSAKDRRVQRRHELARQYGEALATAIAWGETTYRVARRTSDDPATLQLHALHIHDLQERITFHQQWLRVESPHIADSYDALVEAIKRLTRPNIQDAWTRATLTEGSHMNLGDLYQCEVTHECNAFLTAVGGDLDRISPREKA